MDNTTLKATLKTDLSTTINIVRLSPSNLGNFQAFIPSIKSSDAILLMDDGCYFLKHSSYKILANRTNNFYIIAQHAISRGVNIPTNINVITFTELNALIFLHKNSVSWQ